MPSDFIERNILAVYWVQWVHVQVHILQLNSVKDEVVSERTYYRIVDPGIVDIERFLKAYRGGVVQFCSTKPNRIIHSYDYPQKVHENS